MGSKVFVASKHYPAFSNIYGYVRTYPSGASIKAHQSLALKYQTWMRMHYTPWSLILKCLSYVKTRYITLNLCRA